MRRNSKQEREHELADQARLTRAWRAWHFEQLEEALLGLHGGVLERLMVQLKELRTARELVNFISAQDCSVVDDDTRAIVLHQINRAITTLRERQGLAPIDDALPGEPLTAFQIIREIITKVSPPVAGESQLRGCSWVERKKCHERKSEDSKRAD